MLPLGALTKHFALREFNSRDGAAMPPAAVVYLKMLCEFVLEPIREEWGGVISIISGWRSLHHNTGVGGAPGSLHLTGQAADIAPGDMFRVDEFRLLVGHMLKTHALEKVGGFGLYPDWVHVDIRPRKTGGGLYTWKGAGFGAEVIA